MDRFKLLVVCTANLCRSPLAERLWRQALTERLGVAAERFEISSAGTKSQPGTGMHPHAEAVLREWEIDATGFQPRLLTSEQLSGADLILTAERAHRSVCVVTAPATIRRCFTVHQFARLVELVDPAAITATDPVARMRALLNEAFAARSRTQPLAPEEEDLPDPVNQRPAVFSTCAVTLQGAFARTVELIGGA